MVHEIAVPWKVDAIHPEGHCSGGGVLDGPNCDQSVRHPCRRSVCQPKEFEVDPHTGATGAMALQAEIT